MRVVRVVALVIALAIAATVMIFFMSLPTRHAHARDGDDHGNHGDLKAWFDQLASKKGLCCSFADGVKIEDVDWDTQDGHFRVRLNGQWIVVPDAAVITEPNRFGPAVVWPYEDPYGGADGNSSGTQIRCFMPGAGA